jgi:hypothetical protein
MDLQAPPATVLRLIKKFLTWEKVFRKKAGGKFLFFCKGFRRAPLKLPFQRFFAELPI